MKDNRSFAFNYFNYCILFLPPFAMFFSWFFICESITSKMRWQNSLLLDILTIAVCIGIIIYFIIIIGKQKKIFLYAIKQYLGVENVAAYKKIEESLYVGYKFRFRVDEISLKGLDNNNPLVKDAIRQTKKFATVSNISIIGAMFVAGGFILLIVDVFY